MLIVIVGRYLIFSSACFHPSPRSLFLLLSFNLSDIFRWTRRVFLHFLTRLVVQSVGKLRVRTHLFAVVQSVVPLHIAPSNGEIQRLIYFVFKLILNSQKADWPSHKLIWFVLSNIILFENLSSPITLQSPILAKQEFELYRRTHRRKGTQG